jgi:hypothetical protein
MLSTARVPGYMVINNRPSSEKSGWQPDTPFPNFHTQLGFDPSHKSRARMLEPFLHTKLLLLLLLLLLLPHASGALRIIADYQPGIEGLPPPPGTKRETYTDPSKQA